MSKNIFEIGKAYEHNSGMQMFICGMADTILWGNTLIAENSWNAEKLKERLKKAKDEDELIPINGFNNKGLSPVSLSTDATVNWFEISKEKFTSDYISET